MVLIEGISGKRLQPGRKSGQTVFALLCLLLMCGNQAIADQSHSRASTANGHAGYGRGDHVSDAGAGKSSEARRQQRNSYEHHAKAVEQAATSTATTIGKEIIPTASIADISVVEGNAGLTQLVFAVTLSALADGYVSVKYATSDITARSVTDYVARQGTLTIAPGNTTGLIVVQVNADTVPEPDETLTVTLFSPSRNLGLGVDSAVGTIINDDTAAMNDTGITTWADSSTNTRTAALFTFPGQDADHGRDADPALLNNADGRGSFSFTKLDSSGAPLADQAAVYGVTPWDCVQDNVTGLMWEVKTPAGSGGLRDASYEYSWYNSDAASNGGHPGGANGGICADTVNCDTEKYAAAVNAVALCGYSDWRMPKKEELRSIKDYGVSTSGLAIDVNFFPNTVHAWYWSATPAYRSDLVWGVGFIYLDNTGLGQKVWMDHVRLVRGGR